MLLYTTLPSQSYKQIQTPVLTFPRHHPRRLFAQSHCIFQNPKSLSPNAPLCQLNTCYFPKIFLLLYYLFIYPLAILLLAAMRFVQLSSESRE